MNFTREPIIETIMTPREGCKLVVRNSKGAGQEEFVVDALEVVSFSHAIFFRSLERPKCFLVPVSDYEVLEVREARMVLKTTPLEKGIKIGGGRDSQLKPAKESIAEREFEEQEGEQAAPEEEQVSTTSETRFDKKRDRRHRRRRRGRGEEREASPEKGEEEDEFFTERQEGVSEEPKPARNLQPLLTTFPTLLPPPTSLISETMAHFRADGEFRKSSLQEPSESSLCMEKPMSTEEREQIPPPLHIPIPEPVRPLDFDRPPEEETPFYRETSPEEESP